jgi:hypothetical protein
MCRILSKTKLDIIFLQETLVVEEKARKFMNILCPNRMIYAVSSVGKSGGLLVAWNPIFFELKPFLSLGGILLTCIRLPDKRRIYFLNVYGPCTGHKQFWEKMDAKVLLALGDLILARGMNFTTSTEEVWGASTLTDPLVVFFKEL